LQEPYHSISEDFDMTNCTLVFVAGDQEEEQSLIVWADILKDGAAHHIDTTLMQTTSSLLLKGEEIFPI